jgi:1,4-dihydroxy-2-naphthoyl-CoA hydrolase
MGENMFEYKTQIYLHHTDAAGRLYFANQFLLISEAKERFLEQAGLSIADVLADPRLSFPYVHVEADFKSVLVAGDKIRIQVSIEKVGETSVVFAFQILREDGILAGTAKTVSVTMDKVTQTKVPIPQDWREKLGSS